MSLALNASNWCEFSGGELWAMNLRRSNFVAKAANAIDTVGTKLNGKLLFFCAVTSYHFLGLRNFINVKTGK